MLTRRSALSLAAAPMAASDSFLTLRSRQMQAVIAPQEGGELASLRYSFRSEPLELLYRALDYSPRPGWRGKAPWLWPATGRNFAPGHSPDGGSEVTGSYIWEGARHTMPIHGFVRLQPWRVLRANASAARLALASSDATRRHYPWDWEITVDYRLRDSELQIRFHATASHRNQSAMPFSAGNHITFRDPVVPATQRGKLRFTTNSTLQFLKTPEGLPTGEQRQRHFPAPVSVAEIAPEYPLSLGGYPQTAWLRMEDPSGLRIEMEHRAAAIPAEPVIRFNVWGNEECFSPEPWVGLQNSFNRREGLVFLAPGKDWFWDWTIRVSG